MKSVGQYIAFFTLWIIAYWALKLPEIAANVSQLWLFSAMKDNVLPTISAFNIIFLFGCARGWHDVGWHVVVWHVVVLFGVALLAFILAGSASSTAALLSCLCVPLIVGRSLAIRVLGSLMLAALLTFDVVFLIAPAQFPEIIDLVSHMLGKPVDELANTTGRLSIWAMLWEGSADEYFGKGFGMERFVQLLVDPEVVAYHIGDLAFNLNSAHN
ncbi:hypothetical protein ABTU92_30635, partial [Rhodoplanes sp. SY1]